MRKLAMAALLCSLLAPLAAEDLPQIVAARAVAGDVLLIHEDRSTTLVPLAGIRITDPATNSYGFPIGVAVDDPDFTTSYTDKSGRLHTIHTPCLNLSEARCLEKHARRVAAMEAIYPLPPVRDRTTGSPRP